MVEDVPPLVELAGEPDEADSVSEVLGWAEGLRGLSGAPLR